MAEALFSTKDDDGRRSGAEGNGLLEKLLWVECSRSLREKKKKGKNAEQSQILLGNLMDLTQILRAAAVEVMNLRRKKRPKWCSPCRSLWLGAYSPAPSLLLTTPPVARERIGRLPLEGSHALRRGKNSGGKHAREGKAEWNFREPHGNSKSGLAALFSRAVAVVV
uniref:Uncharacterized protein n=1 Tax=Aegilops tauschii TaxID=37682 RepID=M8BXC7_AEGTA